MGRCTSFPYNDRLLVTSQALSIAAFLLSWNDIIFTFPLSFIPFFLQQIAWCCRYSKCCMVISSLACFALSAVCIWIGIWHSHMCLTMCFFVDENVLMVIAFIEAALWLASGVLTMIFVASGRHAKWEEWWDAGAAPRPPQHTLHRPIPTERGPTDKSNAEIFQGDSRSNVDHRGRKR